MNYAGTDYSTEDFCDRYDYDAYDPDNGDDAETYERNCLAAEREDYEGPEDAGHEDALFPKWDLDFEPDF